MNQLRVILGLGMVIALAYLTIGQATNLIDLLSIIPFGTGENDINSPVANPPNVTLTNVNGTVEECEVSLNEAANIGTAGQQLQVICNLLDSSNTIVAKGNVFLNKPVDGNCTFLVPIEEENAAFTSDLMAKLIFIQWDIEKDPANISCVLP